MTALHWIRTEEDELIIFRNEILPEYEIRRLDNKFFIHRLVSDCDPIGPLDTFAEADTIVMKLGVMLMTFEEQAWRICAAKAIKVTFDAEERN